MLLFPIETSIRSKLQDAAYQILMYYWTHEFLCQLQLCEHCSYYMLNILDREANAEHVVKLYRACHAATSTDTSAFWDPWRGNPRAVSFSFDHRFPRFSGGASEARGIWDNVRSMAY